MSSDDSPAGSGGSQQQQLQLVPESVLKRRHDLDEMKARRAAQQVINPRGNRKVFDNRRRAIRVLKPQKFLARAVSRRNHAVRYDRVRRKGMQKRASDRMEERTKMVAEVGDEEGEGTTATEERKEVTYAANSVGADVVFAIRVRNGTGIPSKVRKMLSRMRLRNVNEGVFLKYTGSTRKMLHMVEPWVSYGIVSKSTVADLINRRGHGKVDGKRVPLRDNTIIEKALGDDGIICVEDLVHEIHAAGDGFGKASAFLWPFRLTAIRSDFQKTKLNQKDGGDYGDCGEEMDDLIREML